MNFFMLLSKFSDRLSLFIREDESNSDVVLLERSVFSIIDEAFKY